MGTSEWVSTSMPYLTPREKGQSDAWGAETAARGRRGSQRIVHAGEIAAPPRSRNSWESRRARTSSYAVA